MAAASSSGHAVGVEMDDSQLGVAKGLVNDASFSSAKMAMLRTVQQNFVLTTEQLAALVGEVSMSSDKMEALKIFEDRCLDPENADPIVELFSMSSDKEEAAALVGSWSAAKAGTQADYPIEDDGHRADEDMNRLLGELEDASMSDDKVAALQAELADQPTPPLDAEQLKAVLEKFSFSDDKIRVLNLFAGPQFVYPMTCSEVIALLETLPMSSDQIEVLPALKPFIKDAENKIHIVASFSFSSDKEKAEEILRDVVVKLVPPEPPMAKIQEALRRVGNCPSGYQWRQVSGGWRCAAGGHYVSDENLEDAM